MKTEYRASTISIEIPKPNSEPWVHVYINKMILDDEGNVLNTFPRDAVVSKRLSEVGMNTYQFIDPVTQKQVDISGYGLAQSITSYVKSLIEEKFGVGSFHD